MSCSSAKYVGYAFIVVALLFGVIDWNFHFTIQSFYHAIAVMQPVLIIGLLVRVLMWDFNFCGDCKKD